MIISGLVHFQVCVLSQMHVQVTMCCTLYHGVKSGYYKTSDASQIYMWSCSVIGQSQTSLLRHRFNILCCFVGVFRDGMGS